MSRLKASWELKDEIDQLTIGKELKSLISQLMAQYDTEKSKFANLFYRNNLHYIIDNIDKPGLLTELKEFMRKTGPNLKG